MRNTFGKLSVLGHGITAKDFAEWHYHSQALLAAIIDHSLTDRAEGIRFAADNGAMTLTKEAVTNHVTISTVGLGQDVNRAFAAMRDLYTGIFYVNAPTIGAEVHLPFGGTRATGNGHREAGTAALDVFSEWKSVYVDFSGRLQRAQIDTQCG